MTGGKCQMVSHHGCADKLVIFKAVLQMVKLNGLQVAFHPPAGYYESKLRQPAELSEVRCCDQSRRDFGGIHQKHATKNDDPGFVLKTIL